MLELKNLEADPGFRECLYDLKEIVASQSEVAALLVKLDALVGRDPSETARHLTFLRVEIYSHLLSHIQGVRQPLTRMISTLYASLGVEEPEGTIDLP